MKSIKSSQLRSVIGMILVLSLMFSMTSMVYAKDTASSTATVEVGEIVSYYNSLEQLSDWEEVIALYASGFTFSATILTELGITGESFREKATAAFYGSRIMALIAIGVDPSTFENRNLLAELASKQDEAGSFGTPTDQLYAILALEVMGTQYNRDKAIESLLGLQNEDGGFGFAVGTSDLDTTATTLIALANFIEEEAVEQAIKKAVDYVGLQQIETGGFTSWGSENSNTIARVISGLSAVGEDIYSEEWLQGDNSMFDALQAYELEDHSYTWQLEPKESSSFSTKQCLMAYADLMNGQSAFSYLSNVVKRVSVDLRIEGIENNLVDDTFEVTYFGDSLNTKQVLIEALEAKEISYDIQSASFGDYLNGIAGVTAGHYGGYDGWLYTINGFSGFGIGADQIQDGDDILVYYGDFAPTTLIPTVTIKSTNLGIGEGLVIHVSSTYDAYDANWNATPVTVDVPGAIVVFGNGVFETNTVGEAYISAKDITFGDEMSYKVFKESADGAPALVRTGVMTTLITLDKDKKYYDEQAISDWANIAIYAMRAEGMMLGSENLFSPKKPISKAELATLLMRLTKLDVGDYGSDFEDVKSEDWFYEYISTGVHFRLLEGTNDRIYGSNEIMNRGDLAEMVALALGLEATTETIDYTDLEGIDGETQKAIDAVSEAGLLIGDGRLFHPELYVTREMAAVVVSRILELME